MARSLPGLFQQSKPSIICAMQTGEFPARRLFLVGAVIIAVAAAVAFIYTSAVTANAPQMTPANAVNIIKAARSLTHDLVAARKPIPSSVSLTNLVTLKYLNPADAAPFDGLDATLYLVATNNSSQAVLMRVKMPDGGQTVLLSDGSSQLVPASAKN